MKLVRSLVLVAVLVPALVVVGASSALACSCIPARPDREAVKDAAAVFTGTVVGSEAGVGGGFDPLRWTFEVEAVYKGDVGDTQEVTSNTGPAACGFAFKEEKRYVVFAYEEAGALHTNSCQNTRALADDDEPDLQAIAAPDPVEPVGPSDPGKDASGWDPFVVGSLAIVAVFGILTVVALATGRPRDDLDAALVREELE